MKAIKIFAFFGLIALFSACSPTLSYFTQDLVQENDWSEDELRQIQFYLSKDLVLRRKLTDGSSTIVNGEIKVINGEEYEQIIIREGTPGIFKFSPKHNRLAVSFESGDEQRFLMFGPNPKANGRYVLLASQWDKRRGQVTYDGTQYTVDAEDAYAALMVDLKRTRRVSTSSRVAGGQRL